MSLINDMLKNLEQRRNQGEQKNGAPASGLHSPEEVNLVRKTPRALLIILILLIVAFIAIITIKIMPHKATANKPSNQVAKQINPPSMAPKPLPTKVTAPTVESKMNQSAQQLANITLNNVTESEQNEEATIRLMLSKPTHYQVTSTNNHQTFTITLDKTTLQQALPNISNNIVQQIQSANINGNLQLTLMLAPNTEVGNIAYSNTSRNTLILSFLNTTTTNKQQTTPAVSITQASSAKTKAAQTQQDYQTALNQLGQGKTYQAIGSLESILSESPNFMLARATLIKLLLRENNLTNATKYINQGLANAPDNPTLVILQARLFVQQGNLRGGLNALQAINSPNIQTHPDYYALTAAIQQRLNQPQVTAALYKQLLQTQPNNSVWWMGLGIALESTKQPNLALEAYKQAISTGQLNPNLQVFVTNKVKHLGGR